MDNYLNRQWSQTAVVDIAEYAVVVAITLVTMLGLLRFVGLVR
jgi:hypothetical protein